MFKNLAKGEVGLIITGHAYVNPTGVASPYQTGAYADGLVEGLSQITGAVHKYPSRIFLQLSHAGRQTKPKLCGCTPLAPSSVYEPTFEVSPKEMSQEEIRRVIDDFIQSSRRAKEAGFDGVELHVAHGYLLSSFISPYTNRRKDEWGGTLSNRLRIVVEIIQGIKQLLGKEFPLIVKLNASDFLPEGLNIDESIEIAKILESEVKIKAELSIPVFGLGGIRSFSAMEKIIEKGRADLISMSRPFIRDPSLISRFRAGKIKKSECISCNRCFNLRGISCAELKKKKGIQS
jgi:2,4-dienoyl-CoA reductase-like NADH-dependent reductase (Old Yellow Enzyme family)